MNLSMTTNLRTIALLVAVAAASEARADVTITRSGAKLKITSDADGDSIRIEGLSALGAVGVTVNATSADQFIGIRDITVQGGAGDDSLRVSALQIGGSLSAKLGVGIDTFEMDTTATAIAVPVFIGGSVDLQMGGQAADEVSIQASGGRAVVIGRNLTIRGANDVFVDGGGTLSTTEASDCFVGGNLRIERENAESIAGKAGQAFLDDVNVGSTTTIELGASDDTLTITDSHFAGKFTASLGDGADTIDFVNNDSEFNAAATFDGGKGVDITKQTFQLIVIPDVFVIKNVELKA